MTIKEAFFISKTYISNCISNDLVIMDIVELSKIYIVSYTRKELIKSRVTLFPPFLLDKNDKTILPLAQEFTEQDIRSYYERKGHLFDNQIERKKKKVHDYPNLL